MVRKYSWECPYKQQQEFCTHKLSPLQQTRRPLCLIISSPWEPTLRWSLKGYGPGSDSTLHLSSGILLAMDLGRAWNGPSGVWLEYSQRSPFGTYILPKTDGFLFMYIHLSPKLPRKLLKEKIIYYASLHVSTLAPSLPPQGKCFAHSRYCENTCLMREIFPFRIAPFKF